MLHSSISEGVNADSQNPYLRNIPAITLNEICRERNLPGPYLIKVDVDGQELDVLAGATQILQQTEYIIVEVCLLAQMYDTALFRLVRYTTEVGTRQCRVPTAIEEQSGCTS